MGGDALPEQPSAVVERSGVVPGSSFSGHCPVGQFPEPLSEAHGEPFVSSVAAQLSILKAPVMGFYGGTDMRIGATVPVTEAAMKKLGKFYEVHSYEGAGHGFMGAQAGMGGANLKAAQQAWPLVVQFFSTNLK